jgi:ubiquinone biosynthesis protein COQ4
VQETKQSALYDDVEYMRGGSDFRSTSSILMSSSKYLNSPLIRDWICNEALRRPASDASTIARAPEFYQALDAVFDRETTARLFREDCERLPDLAAWLKERYVGAITYDQVAGAAEGTLGHRVKALLDSGMKLYFGRLGEAESDFEYVRKRRSQVHDIEHIVTGFPATSIAGEMALSLTHIVSSHNYYQPRLAKETALTSTFYVSAWMLRTPLHSPEVMIALCDAMKRGVAMGERLKRPLYMEKWEEYLDWPLPELRAHFGIPDPGAFVGNWDWAEGDDFPVRASPDLAAE